MFEYKKITICNGNSLELLNDCALAGWEVQNSFIKAGYGCDIIFILYREIDEPLKKQYEVFYNRTQQIVDEYNRIFVTNVKLGKDNSLLSDRLLELGTASNDRTVLAGIEKALSPCKSCNSTRYISRRGFFSDKLIDCPDCK